VASGTWVRLGEATTTTSHSSQSFSAVPTTRAAGNVVWIRAVRSASPVTTAARVIPGVAAISGAWKNSPAVPYPISPTRTPSEPMAPP
jgi:hypothetical protein